MNENLLAPVKLNHRQCVTLPTELIDNVIHTFSVLMLIDVPDVTSSCFLYIFVIVMCSIQ